MATNWANPCERWKTLRDAYFRLISGQQESEIEYIANGVNRRARYSVASLADLKTAMDEAQRECEALQGVPTRPKRHAISGSFRGDRVYNRNFGLRWKP